MNTSAHIIEVSMQNFQAEVVEKSSQVPILVEFYAEGAEPSQQIAPVLQRLAQSYAGKFILARVDIQANQQLIQQLNVRTLPTLILIANGQMVKNLEGPQDEPQIRELLDQVTMSPLEKVKEQLAELLEQGNRPEAIAMLQQVIVEEPQNFALQTELSDLLILEGKVDEAKKILSELPKDAEGINKPLNRLGFIDEASKLPSLEQLNSELPKDEKNSTVRYQLAIRLIASDQLEAGLSQLLEILKQDREYGEDLARKTMIRVFDLLGKGSVLATDYRRKMFTLLH